jgi:hypothetical protein
MKLFVTALIAMAAFAVASVSAPAPATAGPGDHVVSQRSVSNFGPFVLNAINCAMFESRDGHTWHLLWGRRTTARTEEKPA